MCLVRTLDLCCGYTSASVDGFRDDDGAEECEGSWEGECDILGWVDWDGVAEGVSEGVAVMPNEGRVEGAVEGLSDMKNVGDEEDPEDGVIEG